MITGLAVLIIVSIVIAAQLPSQPGGSNSPTEVSLLQDSVNTDQNYDETIEPDASQQVDETIEPDANEQLTEENPAIAVEPSSENKAQDVKVDGTVSRGTRTTETTSTVSNTNRNDVANFWQNRKTWLQPVKGKQTADPTGGARYFGASRSNGRVHAAIDFIAPGGTPVYAMTDGKVARISIFFQNTSAVEVQNTDGTVARYCEIAPAVSVGTTVHRGDVIGKIMTNYAGTAMLHLEMYMGTSSGSLSQGSNSSNYKYVPVRNYERRSDLIDPTGAIYLPVK
ncbi:MAG: M23 family metallopeptidase [Syntrophomonadaceae bacterium]|nr:M23 family metallopeptidase [Syntrophomonadaceae bacterium]